MSGGRNDLWQRLDALVDRAPRPDDLIAHRLQMHAVSRYRRIGRDVPAVLASLEAPTVATNLALEPFLARIKAATEAPLLVVKGPEVAARFPDPMLRPFSDVDVLVDGAERVREELLAAGFFEVGEAEKYVGIHHLRPLAVGALPLVVELHHTPKWLAGTPGPTVRELLALARPSAMQVEGFLALPPAAHAVVVAVHSWAHRPLRRIGDLLDIALLVEAEDREEAEQCARAWGVSRVWRTTMAAVEATFGGQRVPLSTRTWARNIRDVRGRTVFENHLERWFSGWWQLPPGQALVQTAHRALADVRPADGETWSSKLRRSATAARRASVRVGEHEHALRRNDRSTPNVDRDPRPSTRSKVPVHSFSEFGERRDGAARRQIRGR